MSGPIWRHTQRGARLLLVALALLAAWAGGVVAASAHASLTSTEPKDGSVVAAPPSLLSLSFSEPVSPLALTLVRPDGSSRSLDRFALRDKTLEIEAPGDMGQGTHVLSWRVVSEDGHPVGGAMVFSVGAPSVSPPVLAETIDWPVRAAIWTTRIALYLGFFFGIGSVFASVWVIRSEPSKLATGLIFLGLAAVPLSIAFQGLDALAAPLGGITSLSVWKAGFATSFGRTAMIAAVSFAAAYGAGRAPPTLARLLSLLSLIGVGAALAASGHASAAEPRWLTRSMVFLHGVAIAFWAGALPPLFFALNRRTLGVRQGLMRFSSTIPFVVAALILAGTVLAVIQVEAPAALVETAYGRVLLVKLALLAGLFALSLFNRWTLTASVERGDAVATRSLARSVSAETLIMIVIFAVAASWRFTPPPRALAIAAALPSSIHIHQADAMVDLSITPGRAGPVDVSIVIMTGDFGPLDAREVTLVLSNPSAGIEPIRRAARKPGDGTWRIDQLVVPAAGAWTVRIDILISDFQVAKLTGQIDIRP